MRGDLPSLPGNGRPRPPAPPQSPSVTASPEGAALSPLVRLNRNSFHRSAGVFADVYKRQAQKAAAQAANAPAEEEKPAESAAASAELIGEHEEEISFDDFCKVELRDVYKRQGN